MNNRRTVFITSIENRNGVMFIRGEIKNNYDGELSVPELGVVNKSGVVETSYGTVERNLGKYWQSISPMRDGIRLSTTLQPGEVIRFVFDTGIIYPDESIICRVKFSNSVMSAPFEL